MQWSEDEQVFYLNNWAWGVDKKGISVRLGEASEILKEHPLPKGRILKNEEA